MSRKKKGEPHCEGDRFTMRFKLPRSSVRRINRITRWEERSERKFLKKDQGNQKPRS